MSLKRDLDFGIASEDNLFSKIKGVYGDDVCKTSQYCKCDYESETVMIELKTRRNSYNAYPTTMVPASKITYMLDSGKKSFCLFYFTDGLYAIEIDNYIIREFDLREGGRYDRGRPELNSYYFIPIGLLTKL